MAQVVNVKFRNRGKIYYFDPKDIDPKEGDMVVVETSKGLELASCVKRRHEVEDDKVVQPLMPVVRIATDEDLKMAEENKAKEAYAMEVCREKIAERGLDMKLIDVECSFDGSKILFFFTSDGRVDFRDLVKDLASVFRARIELRQIGVRDSAKILGGIGVCGRPFCCATFLDEFQPVSIKMAKTQSLSLNPTKISGVCERLMCCLKYEQAAYEELVKKMPKNDSLVNTPEGAGTVVDVNCLRQTVKVRMLENGQSEAGVQLFHIDDIEVLRSGKKKPNDPEIELPPPLKPRKKEEEEELPQDDMPDYSLIGRFAETDEVKETEVKDKDSGQTGEKKRRRRPRRRRPKRPGNGGSAAQEKRSE